MRYVYVILLAFVMTPLFAQEESLPTMEHNGLTDIAVTKVSVPCPEPVPLKGVVTFIAGDGKFYLNLGQYDGIREKASLQIMRQGQIVGNATVNSVDFLDSFARLNGGSRSLQLTSGDVVVVKHNPSGPARVSPLAPFPPDDGFENLIWLAIFGELVYPVTQSPVTQCPY